MGSVGGNKNDQIVKIEGARAHRVLGSVYSESSRLMNAYEFERHFWRNSVKEYRFQTTNLKNGFAPLGGKIADFSIIRKGFAYHLFYIERRIGGLCSWPGHEIFFGHTSTQNFINWQVHDPIMLVQPGTWESAHVFAPYVFRYKSKYAMIYAGLNDHGAQALGLAFSNDLFNWKRYRKNPILTPRRFKWAEWKEKLPSSCRDPHVFVEKSTYYLTYTACTKKGETCVALASSKNLKRWRDHGPIFIGARSFSYKSTHPRHVESACLEKFNGKYFLFISYRGGIRYLESDTIGKFMAPNKLIWKGHLGLEVIKKYENKWLVCSFDLAKNRFRVTKLKWNKNKPKSRPVLHFIQ